MTDATSVPVTADLRVAVLGVGVMGEYHARALSSRIRGARVTVVSDAATDRAESVAAALPGARAVLDPMEAIGADDVDAVVIASPDGAHEKQVLACLERGLPVLCEKPLTTESETAYEVVRAEAALGRRLVQVGFMRRFDPEYAALRELIVSGGLGAPLLAHCVHRNPDVPTQVSSATVITNTVVHEADAVRFLFGEEIAAVTVIRPTATSRAPAGVSDPMLVLLETESGRLADVEAFVRTGVAYEVRTEIVGELGSAMIGLDHHLVRTGSDGRWGGRIAPGFRERFDVAYQIELQHWVTAARTGTIDGPGTWDGYAAAAVCEAGVESVRTGARVAVRMGPRP
jgi:myo-inositol 2-dehydrogenase/D-chiro-inositol 1-dehydrogenase